MGARGPERDVPGLRLPARRRRARVAVPRKAGGVSDFERVVADALRRFNWRYVHQRPAQTARGWRTALTGDKGFPDFVAARGDRLLFIEVKGNTTHLDAEQRAWHLALLATGAECFVWRPRDFDEVMRVLAPAGVRIEA